MFAALIFGLADPDPEDALQWVNYEAVAVSHFEYYGFGEPINVPE